MVRRRGPRPIHPNARRRHAGWRGSGAAFFLNSWTWVPSCGGGKTKTPPKKKRKVKRTGID